MAAQSGKTRSADTRTPAETEEQRSPEQIQTEIEATREEMGETVAELADKADVRKQAKRKVAEAKAKATAKKDEVKRKVTAQQETVTEKLKESAPDSAQQTAQEAAGAAQTAAGQAADVARLNPVQAAAACGFAGGVVVGWMLGRR